eukprot:jgi/Orpsp1_1/1183361/evm.model.c7180000084847.1
MDLWHSYIDQLYEFFTVVDTDDLTLAKACEIIKSSTKEKYLFDSSEKAKQRQHALKHIAAILKIPVEILTMIDGKVYLIYLPLNGESNNIRKSYFDQLQPF